MKRFLPALLAALVFAGCATEPKIDWAARIGNYTYDQAVLDFGPPEKSVKLDSGIVVANWITRHGYAYSTSPSLGFRAEYAGLLAKLFALIVSAADFWRGRQADRLEKIYAVKISFRRSRARVLLAA